MKFKFTCIDADEKGNGRRVYISLDTIKLCDVLEDFENFLTSCGFVHNGLTFDSKEELEAEVKILEEKLAVERNCLEFYKSLTPYSLKAREDCEHV